MFAKSLYNRHLNALNITMKIITFNYTKADDTVSKRVLAVLVEPAKLYGGTDISSLSDEDQAVYAMRVDEIRNSYLDALKNLNSVFDLNHNYRQFKPDCMSAVVHEDI